MDAARELRTGCACARARTAGLKKKVSGTFFWRRTSKNQAFGDVFPQKRCLEPFFETHKGDRRAAAARHNGSGDTVNTQTIPAEQWPEFFARFSRDHADWPTTIE